MDSGFLFLFLPRYIAIIAEPTTAANMAARYSMGNMIGVGEGVMVGVGEVLGEVVGGVTVGGGDDVGVGAVCSVMTTSANVISKFS